MFFYCWRQRHHAWPNKYLLWQVSKTLTFFKRKMVIVTNIIVLKVYAWVFDLTCYSRHYELFHTLLSSFGKVMQRFASFFWWTVIQKKQCVKSVPIWRFSGPYFPAFIVNLHIQSKSTKIRTIIQTLLTQLKSFSLVFMRFQIT